MDARLSLIGFVLLTLQGGNACLIDAEDIICTGTKGGNITVKCSFAFSGKKRIFCKGKCKDGDVLVETEKDRDQDGRYSIYYDKGSILDYSLLNVSITNLSKSDSGWYQCGLVRTISFISSYWEFKIRVLDAPVPPKPNRTPRPPSVTSASTQTTTQTPDSTSGSSTATSASLETSSVSQQPQTTATAAAPPAVLLYVGLTLVVVFIIFLVALLVFCRKRVRNPKAPPVETEYADVTEANRVYEEIREDRGSSPPPVQISTVYTSAKYSKPNGAETCDDYSFATAPSPPNKTEDDSSKLTYSVVHFPSAAAASLHSAPCGDNVVYSVPKVAASSDGSQSNVASPPLYSTLSLQQI